MKKKVSAAKKTEKAPVRNRRTYNLRCYNVVGGPEEVRCSPELLSILHTQVLKLFGMVASMERLLLKHYKGLGAVVAEGAHISELSARPSGQLDRGQRGAMQDALSGRRTFTQQQEEALQAHKLLDESKRRKLKDDEIDMIQRRLNAVETERQELVRTNSMDVRKRREMRMGFAYDSQ